MLPSKLTSIVVAPVDFTVPADLCIPTKLLPTLKLVCPGFNLTPISEAKLLKIASGFFPVNTPCRTPPLSLCRLPAASIKSPTLCILFLFPFKRSSNDFEPLRRLGADFIILGTALIAP